MVRGSRCKAVQLVVTAAAAAATVIHAPAEAVGTCTCATVILHVDVFNVFEALHAQAYHCVAY